MEVKIKLITCLLLISFKVVISIKKEHLIATDLLNYAIKDDHYHFSTEEPLIDVIENYFKNFKFDNNAPVKDEKQSNLIFRPLYSDFPDLLRSPNSGYQDVNNNENHINDHFDESGDDDHKRRKRSLADRKIDTMKVNLNDSNSLLILHWAGKGSGVIISLTRDRFQTSPTFTSNLYISRDYGKTFVKRNLFLRYLNRSEVSWFYLSPILNTHYIFLDTIQKSLWTTKDAATSFVLHPLTFHPSIVLFHPTEWKTIAVLELVGYGVYNVHISTDFADTWKAALNGVISFEWGNEEYNDKPGDTYIHTDTPSAIIKYNYLHNNKTQLFSNPTKLIIEKEFVLVVEENKNRSEVSLWVSTDRIYFSKANLPKTGNYTDIYVADASENQIIICATQNVTQNATTKNATTQTTHLYVSDPSGLYFTLSLKNILYFNPNKNSKSWLRYFIGEPFTDLYKVNGLSGIYMATVLKKPNKTINPGNLDTMITFNKGADWRYLPDPGRNISNFYDLLICVMFSGCNLHLAQLYHAKLSFASLQPITSSPSAPGLVIGSGRIGSIHNTSVNTYISSDGGIYWRKSLSGAYTIVIGDHGGFLVALKVKDVTNNLLYSTDEGHSWQSYQFNDEMVKVYGVYTEPGEESGVFTIFGSNTIAHSWMIIQVNLTSIYKRECTDTDYTYWVPSDHPKVGCLLGRRMVYEKKKPFAECYNGRNYDRDIKEESCACKMENFVCDYGYQRNRTSGLCVVNSYMLGSRHACYHGDYYNRSRGYRRVALDSCEGGMDVQLEPVLTNCPVKEKDEFILLANMTSIHKYSYLSNKTTQIQLRNLMNVAAIDYNYAKDCVYFADNMFDNIQKICLRGDDLEQKVILTENMDQIESLRYDWTSEQLYWLDVAHKRIECVKLGQKVGDGKAKGQLGNEEVGIGGRRVVVLDGLNNPRSLAIAPKLGIMIWSCWDTPQKGTIHKSNMAGGNIEQIFETTSNLNITTPSGLTIDVDNKLYFLDAKTGVIVKCNIDGGDGKDCKVLYDNGKYNKHPGQQQFFSLAVFKNSLLWTEAIEGSVKLTNKVTSTRPLKLLNGYHNVISIVALHATSQTEKSSCSANPCTDQNSLCFETSKKSFFCKCAKGFVEKNGEIKGKTKNVGNKNGIWKKDKANVDVKCGCPSGSKLVNGFCVAEENKKCIDEFTCANKRCIPDEFVCDHDDDCGDMSDEKNCSFSCPNTTYECDNGRCVDLDWVCDLSNDCLDNSDETKEACAYLKNKVQCEKGEFKCDYGKCIEDTYRCNGDDDCHDGSDEKDCQYYTTTKPFTCAKDEFACAVEKRCISSTWKCNGNRDCSDGSDEQGCANVNCISGHVICQNGAQCVVFWKWCDGEEDCDDGSDEVKCNFTTTSLAPPSWTSASCSGSHFKCRSSPQCLQMSQVCDGINDCTDFSDESSCDNCLPPEKFRCVDGGCVGGGLKCNGRDDCVDGSDEDDCEKTTIPTPLCKTGMVRCGGDGVGLSCIPESWLCDGEKDCTNGWDEKECYDIPITCSQGLFSCLFSKSCLDPSMVCNGRFECPDASDEMHCNDVVPPAPSCQSNEWTCMIGGCINKMAVCNERWDCIGGSDEHNCTYKKLEFTPKFQIVNITSVSITFKLEALNGVDWKKIPSVSMLYSVGSSTRNIFKSGVINVQKASLPLVTKVNNLHSNTMYYLTLTFSYQGQLTKQSTKECITNGVNSMPHAPQSLATTFIHTPHDLSVTLSWKASPIVGKSLYKLQYKVVLTDTTTTKDSKYGAINLYTFGTKVNLNGRELMIGHTYIVKVYAFSTSMSESSNSVEFTYESECMKLQEGKIIPTSSSKPPPSSSPPSSPPSSQPSSFQPPPLAPPPSNPSPPTSSKSRLPSPSLPSRPISYIVNLNHASLTYSYSTTIAWLLPQKTIVYLYKFRVSRLSTKSEGSAGSSGGSNSSGRGSSSNKNASNNTKIIFDDGDDDSFKNMFGDDNDTLMWALKTSSARDVECREKGKCTIQVLGLNPGSVYIVDVWADNVDGVIAGVCYGESLFLQTPALKFSQKAFDIEVLAKKNSVEINVKNLGRNIKMEKSFIIETRYGQIGSKQINTKQFKITDIKKDFPLRIDKLSSCEKYCFDVSVVWPYRNQLSDVVCVDVHDAKDNLEAPKRVVLWKMAVAMDRTKVDVIMQWEPPCQPKPANYTVNVDMLSEGTPGEVLKSKSFDVNDVIGLKVIRYKVSDLFRGHKYRVKVRKNNPVGHLSEAVYFEADPYPSPANLTYELLVSNAVLFILKWFEPLNELPPKYEYEIQHSSLYRSFGLLAPFTPLTTTNTTSYLSINQLNPDVENSFKVRLVSEELKIKSNFSNVVTVLFRPDQLERLSLIRADKKSKKWSLQNKILAITIPILAMLVLLSLVVVYYVRLKHSNSGLNGVNPRYSSGSDRAILALLGEDEDQALISGSNEDDVLIIA